MKNRIIQAVKALLFLAPFVLGTVGFCLSVNDGLVNAMYRAMRLYFVELDCEYGEMNLCINIARWMAPVMSAAAILTALSRIFTDLRTRLRVSLMDAAAIHGDSRYVGMLAERMGLRAVTGEERAAFAAKRQVLIFNEDRDMFAFLENNRKKLLDGEKTVYLCTEGIVRGNYKNRQIVLCNFAENCARRYWNRFPLDLEPTDQVIVIIGFDSYGQEVLTQALLTNVYGADTRIQYHVFGDSEEYKALHWQLDKALDVDAEHPTRDCVYFHNEKWFENARLINSADRVILVEDEEENNLLALNELNKFYKAHRIYIKAAYSRILAELWGGSSVFPFGTEEELCEPETIFDEATFRGAKRIHARYFCGFKCPRRTEGCGQNGEACLQCSEFLTDWHGLDAFTRYSNIAQADHVAVKVHILLGDGYKSVPNAGEAARRAFEALSEDERLCMCETEHIRWLRYHYLNNWEYAPTRCNAEKQHHMLVPFESLSFTEQLKDADAWHNAFLLYDSEPEGEV